MPGHWGNKVKRKAGRVKLNERVKDFGGVTKLYQNVLGIYHTDNRLNLAEAVPPAYSEYIAKEFFRTREFYRCG